MSTLKIAMFSRRVHYYLMTLQEMALYGDFTMNETLYYFGVLHGMSLKVVRERRAFLTEFLELPANKLIRRLR